MESARKEEYVFPFCLYTYVGKIDKLNTILQKTKGS